MRLVVGAQHDSRNKRPKHLRPRHLRAAVEAGAGRTTRNSRNTFGRIVTVPSGLIVEGSRSANASAAHSAHHPNALTSRPPQSGHHRSASVTCATRLVVMPQAKAH